MKMIQPIIYGLIAAFAALVLEIVVIIIFSSQNTQLSDLIEHLTTIFAITVLIEEAMKFLLIYKTSSQKTDSKEIFIHALLIGFGFSVAEIFFKQWNEILSQFYLYIGLIGLFMIHLSTSSLFAWAMTKISTAHKKFAPAVISLAVAFGMHLLYDSLWIYDTRRLYMYAYLAGQAMLIFFIGRSLIVRKTAVKSEFAK